jgi:hypothetical protein
MSQQQNTQCITLKAGADLSAGQYRFVEISAARTVTIANAITDIALGVLQNDPAAADLPASIAINGTTKVLSGAAITAGARVSPTADGRAQASVSTQFPRGIALETAAGANEVIEILLLGLTVNA